MTRDDRALVEALAAALAPLRQRTDAFPFAIASEGASFTIAVTKTQILAANAAMEAASLALAEPPDPPMTPPA